MRILIVGDEPMMLDMAEDAIKEVKPEAEILCRVCHRGIFHLCKRVSDETAGERSCGESV